MRMHINLLTCFLDVLINIITPSRRVRDVIMGYKINLKVRKHHLKPSITTIQKEPVNTLRPRKRTTRRGEASNELFSLSLFALLINSTIHSQATQPNYSWIINMKLASFFFSYSSWSTGSATLTLYTSHHAVVNRPRGFSGMLVSGWNQGKKKGNLPTLLGLQGWVK